jgi:peptide/nickel transport system substrate-binding protein
MSGRRMLICFVVISVIWGLAAGNAFSAAERKLLIAVDQEPSTVDPTMIQLSVDYVIGENWAEYLIYRAPDGKLGPGLATSWKVSPDGKEIEFTLRKGVKFHSGDSMTAKDVQFSFERENAKNPNDRTRLRSMERFELIDDYRFKIHFKAPDVTFIPNRACVRVISKNHFDRVGEEVFSKEASGTGPYKFVRYVFGQYIDIERFDGYWGEKPPVKEARFLFIPDEATRVAKLMAGEVDLLNNCPYPAVQNIEKSAGLKVVRFGTNAPTPSVIFANRNPKVPWYDKRVRMAMGYAIDCDSIIKSVLHGIPNRWAFLAPDELGYDRNLKPYSYDPKKARELLAQAGYAKGFDLKLYWMLAGVIPMSREVSEAIASYLEAVGIRVKLIGEDLMAGVSRRRAAKAPDSDFVAFHPVNRSGGPDPSYYLDLYFGCEGSFSAYCNPELDKITAEAKTTVNDAKRAEVIRRAIKVVEEDAATIPIFNCVIVYGMKKDLSFTPTRGIIHPMVFVKDVKIN